MWFLMLKCMWITGDLHDFSVICLVICHMKHSKAVLMSVMSKYARHGCLVQGLQSY